MRLVWSLDAELIEIAARSLQVTVAAVVIASVLGLPPVVVGLIVYLMLSRSGPFGVLGLLFTPLIASITHQAVRELWSDYRDLLLSLGAIRRQRIAALLWDGRRALLIAWVGTRGR